MPSKTSKRTARKSKPAPSRAIDQAALAQVFLWIVQGQTEAAIIDAATVNPDLIKGQDVRQLITEARAEIAKAANLDPALVSAWCFEAYRELHRRCVEMGDLPAAIRAVAKIDELKRRAAAKPAEEGAPAESEAEAEARAHLAPLFDDGNTLPLAELARLAAARIVSP